MAHVRKQIRDRISSTLSSGVALVSSRVYPSRVYPLTEANLPAVTVYSGVETSSLLNMSNKDMIRNVTVNVDAYVRITDTFDDDIDAICVQIEAAMAGDFTVNNLAKDAILTSTEIDFSGDTEQPIGVARLTYNVRYVTAIDDAEAAK